jgi:signal peptidase I
MLPTLKDGDILEAVQYSQRKFHIGDIIAFHSPIGGTIIVHRIAAICKKGVKTKGDNNFRFDDWVLSPNDIIGKIVSARRGKKIIIILNGFLGQLFLSTIRAQKRIHFVLMSFLLSFLYRWFSSAGIFKKFFSRRLKTRLCCFKSVDNLEFRLILGRQIIGRLLPGQKQWNIKRPFRLIVDEKSLLKNDLVKYVSSHHSLPHH